MATDLLIGHLPKAPSTRRPAGRLWAALLLSASLGVGCTPKAAPETNPVPDETPAAAPAGPDTTLAPAEGGADAGEGPGATAPSTVGADGGGGDMAPGATGAGDTGAPTGGGGLTTLGLSAEDAFAKANKEIEDGKGSYRDAIKYLERAVQADPDFAEAHYNLGCLHQELGRLQKAQTSYEDAIKADSEYLLAYVNLASVQRERREYEDALETLDKAIKLNPLSARARNERIAVLRAAGRSKEAVDEAHALLRDNSNDAYAFVNLAFAYADTKNLDMSRLVFDKAFATFTSVSTDPAARHAYGLLLLEQGERDLAIVTGFDKALEAQPDYVPALVNRARLHLEDSEAVEAVALLQRAVDAEPMNVTARLMLGVALRRAADYEAAEAQYELILASNPDNYDAIYNLGVLYSNYLQDADQALSAFTRAKAVAPDQTLVVQLDEYIQEAQREIANRERMERLKQLREEAARKRAAEEAAKPAEEDGGGEDPAGGDGSDGAEDGGDGGDGGEDPPAEAPPAEDGASPEGGVAPQ